MGKRKTDTESTTETNSNKRSKDKALHSKSCEDPECVGCDDGEIEVNPGTKDAFELYALAKQEQYTSEHQYSADTHQRIVLKLYELALEAFETRIDSTSKPNFDVQFGFAKCLHDFGRFNGTLQHTEKCIQLCKNIVDNSKEMKSQVTVLMARSCIDLIDQAIRGEQDTRRVPVLAGGKKYIQDALKLISSLHERDLISESTQKEVCIASLLDLVDLCNEYIDDYEEVFEETFASEATSLARKLMSRYADLGDDSNAKYLGAKVMYAYISRVGEDGPSREDSEDVFASIDFLESYVIQDELSEEEKVSCLQLLSALYLESVSLYEDDDEGAMSAVHHATSTIKRALEIIPDDEDLLQQYAELQAAEDLDEGSEADYAAEFDGQEENDDINE